MAETQNYVRNVLVNSDSFKKQLKRSKLIGTGHRDVKRKKLSNNDKFDKVQFDASFENVNSGLIVGKHNSGKTRLIQEIVYNGLIPSLKKIIIVTPSSVQPSYKITNNKYFENYEIVYYSADNKAEVDDVLEEIEQFIIHDIDVNNSNDYNNEEYENEGGELSKKVEYLIILDDMTAKAERSHKLSAMYTTCRKIKTLIITVFHLFSRSIENLLNCSDFVILFNLPGNSSFLKTFLSNEGRKVSDIRKVERNQTEGWLYQLYHSDLMQNRHTHLLIMQVSPASIDNFVGKGPFTYRTQCSNPDVQIGYFPSRAVYTKCNEYDTFQAKRNYDYDNEVVFEIENLTKVTKGGDSYIRKEIAPSNKNVVKQMERDIINNP